MFRRSHAALALAGSMGLVPAALAQVEPLQAVEVASGLNRPVFATHAPDDYTRLFILEKAGVIKILNIKTGVVNTNPFLNINSSVGGGNDTNDERGLLGLAFHPDYQNNDRFFVYYTNNASDTVVAEFTRSSPDIANPSGDTILFIDQPFLNHNGGWIDFGPNDGLLYIGTGDGGSACDPGQRAQDITSQLLGKMLRIDVDGDDFPADTNRDYAIPPSNPFVGVNGDDEIWAYGLRNPWRAAFDRLTGDLYIADVGQGQREEVNFQPASSTGGENYGWDCMEGNSCASISGCGSGACSCNSPSLTDPFQTYNHVSGNCSIDGGYVYRGCAIPSLDGHYFYADWCSERIWSLVYDGNSISDFTDRTAELNAPAGTSIDEITSFGEDARGEIYLCDQGFTNSGQIFKIVPVTPTISDFDLDCNGEVDVDDLVALVLAWGQCDGCLEDVTGDGRVNVDDLVEMVLNWG